MNPDQPRPRVIPSNFPARFPGAIAIRWEPRFFAALGLIVLAAAFRVLPHLPNFSPVTAMALFAGAYFTRLFGAVLVPLAAMVLSDAVIGFHSLVPAVYGAFILVTCLGFYLQGAAERRRPIRLAGAAVTGSLLFFLITNFAVWAQGDFYPKSGGGLLASYVAGLPFLQNSVVGDLCFTAGLFGAWTLLVRTVPGWRTARVPAGARMI